MQNRVEKLGLGRPLWDIAALLGGAAFPLAFAPFEWRPLSWLALAILFLSWYDQSPRRALLRGWLWGMGAFLVGVSWVYNSMHKFGGASELAAGSFAVLFAIYLAIYPGLAGYLWRKLFASRSTVIGIIGVALLWPITEWLRAWVLTGFPWLMTGFAQLDTPFANWLPVAGVLGGSAVVAACVMALLQGVLKKQPGLLGGAAVLLLVSALLGVIDWRSEDGKELDVALVQGNIPQELKLKREYLGLSLQTYYELSEPHFDADLIVWPETAMPTYRYALKDYLGNLTGKLKEQGAVVFTGIFMQAQTEAGRNDYYNAMLEVGGQEQVYIKHQLVPFGEYMPVRWLMKLFSSFVEIPKSDMASGALTETPLNLAGVDVSASICYEMGYPDVLRAQLPAAELLVNTSNDAWFGDSFAPHQHLEMTRARALELARPVVRSTNTGATAFVDEKGDVLSTIPLFEPGVLRQVIRTNTAVTPFTLLGQWWIGCILFVFLIMSVVATRKSA